MTTTRENISGVIKVLDEYMIRSGKEEINEMEANRELAKAGLLADEQAQFAPSCIGPRLTEGHSRWGDLYSVSRTVRRW